MSARLLSFPAALLAAIILAGCSSTPVTTLDEALDRDFAKRPLPRDRVERLIPYNINLVYAHTAWRQLDDPELPTTSGIDTQSTLEVPLAIADYFAAGAGAAAAGLLFSFGTTDPVGDEGRRHYAFNLERTIAPNTHYYLIDERAGTATPEDVDFAWDQAYRVFEAVHNRDGACRVDRWTPERQYSGVSVRNARGVLKQVDFLCTHPLYDDIPFQVVRIQAWGNPFDDIRALAAIQTRCWTHQLPPGERFRDYRDCGERLAARQRPHLPETELPLMELITTPTVEDPTAFKVVARYGDRITLLPVPPGIGDEYVEFLASRPYSVEVE